MSSVAQSLGRWARQFAWAGGTGERTVILPRELELPDPRGDEEGEQNDQHDQGRSSHGGEVIDSPSGASGRLERELRSLPHIDHHGGEPLAVTEGGAQVDLE